MSRNTYQQSVVGKSGEAADQGGHLIASALGGAGDKINLVPMDKVLNNGEWKQMENTLSGVSFNTEMILLGATILMFFTVWFFVKNTYVKKQKRALPENQYTGWEKLSARKLFVDEIYNACIVRPFEEAGKAAAMFDKAVLDPIVNFIGLGAADSGRAAKRLQNGNVENYVLIMSLAVGIVLIVNFLLK